MRYGGGGEELRASVGSQNSWAKVPGSNPASLTMIIQDAGHSAVLCTRKISGKRRRQSTISLTHVQGQYHEIFAKTVSQNISFLIFDCKFACPRTYLVI